VSTPHPHHEGTIASPVRFLPHDSPQPGWSLRPVHESLDASLSGTRLDRPALDRLRDGAQRGDFEAAVVFSSDRLARHDAQQWRLIEECTTLHTPVSFLPHPLGAPPQANGCPRCRG
jgi:site-specific DNA recombinase